MKILFYINQIYEGGAERVITQLASSFADAGHESILVTSFEHSDEYYFSRKVRRLSLEGKQLEQSRIKRNVSRIRKLRTIIKNEAPDIVLSFMQEPNFRALISSFGLPCKNIVSVRNDPNREYAGKIGLFVGKVLMPLLADGCVFQTKQASEWFPERLREKSSVIPNEVANAFFETERSGEEKYWVAIGRLASQKNYPMMIKAFREVIKNYPEQKLKIYGAGPQHKELENLIIHLGLSSSVSLEGQTHDVPSVLSGAIGFLMTSDYEGMPNALMEAMAMGLPCIATDCPCGGPAELINNFDNGILVGINSESELSDAICSLIENRELANSIGNKARISMKLNDPRSIFSKWETFLDSLLISNER